MVFLYYTKEEVKSQVLFQRILLEKYGYSPSEIQKNGCGKPYLTGNPLFFNATNTKGFSALAVASSEIGLDAEPLSRLQRDALTAFVAKEAFVKRIGDSIFRRYKALSFCDGVLYEKGAAVDKPIFLEIDDFLVCVSCKDAQIQTINLDKE